MKFAKLRGGFEKVFSWYYKDLHGFYLGLTQHAISIKEGMKLVRKKQGPNKSVFKETCQK
jgi:hypothetical protein